MSQFFKRFFFAVLCPMLLASYLFVALTGCDEDDSPTTVTKTDTVTVTDTLFEDGMKILRDSDIQANEQLTLSSDTTYLLKGFVFVEDGAVLTIEAGTVIKGAPGGGLNASALIIAKGGKIIAEGTATAPIIMTAQNDDLTAIDDLSGSARGMWGGLIVLGKSTTNRKDGFEQIEGIDPNDSRGQYGGTDTADSSGVIKYVSIRYGGTNIGEGNEINGLTMGGVGSKTVIEYVEVYNNADDGFEFFGGTVNTKHLAAIGCADDSYDWDEGFRGKGQFWVVVQSDDAGDRGAECDGSASDNFGNDLYSMPTIYNATFIGSGASSNNSGNMIFKLRQETAAKVYNSIFTDFFGDIKISSGSLSLVGVINFDDEDGVVGKKVSDRVLSGELEMTNNLFYSFGYGVGSADSLVKFSSVDSAAVKDSIVSIVSTNNTFGQDAGVTRDNLLPTAGGVALTASRKAIPAGDAFFEPADYIGAFNTTNWLSGWSFFSQL
ncbi:MAG: T9SS C-terminal target domain-containing protein [Chitinivibrionales bacterium]|nr:T9SS C-terminal target domain-containing protein [Chitinivibrionales bacterium]